MRLRASSVTITLIEMSDADIQRRERMRQTPILHFSGRFRFHMPEYNNDPTDQRVDFDPSRSQAEVMTLCGCDPAHYLEFTFFDTRITRLTYQDGTASSAGDPVMGQEVALRGFFPDVSPSAICARLYAGEI